MCDHKGQRIHGPRETRSRWPHGTSSHRKHCLHQPTSIQANLPTVRFAYQPTRSRAPRTHPQRNGVMWCPRAQRDHKKRNGDTSGSSKLRKSTAQTMDGDAKGFRGQDEPDAAARRGEGAAPGPRRPAAKPAPRDRPFPAQRRQASGREAAGQPHPRLAPRRHGIDMVVCP